MRWASPNHPSVYCSRFWEFHCGARAAWQGVGSRVPQISMLNWTRLQSGRTSRTGRGRKSDGLKFLIPDPYSEFTWKNGILSTGICFPQPCSQPCSSYGRMCHVTVKITFEIIPTNWFVFTTTNSMKCSVNWISIHTIVERKKESICIFTLWLQSSGPGQVFGS